MDIIKTLNEYYKLQMLLESEQYALEREQPESKLHKMLKESIEEIKTKMSNIEMLINRVDNEELRAIARSYYIEHKSIPGIAKQFNYSTRTISTRLNKFNTLMKGHYFMDNKKKELIEMIQSVDKEGVIDYLLPFVRDFIDRYDPFNPINQGETEEE